MTHYGRSPARLERGKRLPFHILKDGSYAHETLCGANEFTHGMEYWQHVDKRRVCERCKQIAGITP